MKLQVMSLLLDDGRLFCHPIKRGWRWMDGRMVFCLRWEAEDMDKSLLELTVEAFKGSMVGVMEYLQFTFETGTILL